MFLPQAPSARATPSPLVDMPGRPAIHCAKDRSIPWHTIRIIGCGVVPFLYVYSRSLLVLYCTVTPLCASVARLVSGVVWYSEAPRPRVARRRSSRPERVGVCCFKLHWWIAWRARDFRLIGDWVSTEHSGRVRPLCSNIRDTSRLVVSRVATRASARRGAVAGAAREQRSEKP
jgi:hypothetical protein